MNCRTTPALALAKVGVGHASGETLAALLQRLGELNNRAPDFQAPQAMSGYSSCLHHKHYSDYREHPMKRFLQIILASVFTLSLAACGDDPKPAEPAAEMMEEAADMVEDTIDNDGMMEEAGEDMDDMMDEAADAADDAMESMDEMADDAADAMDDAGDEMEDMMDDASDEMDDAMDRMAH